MADTDIVATVILVKLVMLALTLVLTHLTFRAYQRTHRPELWALSIGFASMAVGILLGGGVYQFLGAELMIGLLVEAAFSALGLGMIVYSLYGFQ